MDLREEVHNAVLAAVPRHVVEVDEGIRERGDEHPSLLVMRLLAGKMAGTEAMQLIAALPPAPELVLSRQRYSAPVAYPGPILLTSDAQIVGDVLCQSITSPIKLAVQGNLTATRVDVSSLTVSGSVVAGVLRGHRARIGGALYAGAVDSQSCRAHYADIGSMRGGHFEFDTLNLAVSAHCLSLKVKEACGPGAIWAEAFEVLGD